MAGEAPEVPRPDAIGRELVSAGLLGARDAFGLESLPRNTGRLDCATRFCFRVHAGGRSLCHLTVGRDLGDLAARIRDFSEACPGFACKPLFSRRVDGWEFLGTEYFDGEPLDGMLRTGAITLQEAIAHAGAVLTGLDLTLRPSTREAADGELERFLSEVRGSPLFSRTDLQFLEKGVFPFLHEGALAGPLRTRWTNGDFVPANLLVDARGNSRLVDCEFATRTHFFGEDRWRWRAFAALAPAGLDLPPRDSLPPVEPWLEAYSILRQLLLAYRVNAPRPAAAVADHFGSRLVAVVATMNDPRALPTLFGLLAATEHRPAPWDLRSQGKAQVFWSGGGGHKERDSAKVAFPFGEQQSLHFALGAHQGPLLLRFDPCDCVGLLEISWIRVHADGELLLELSGLRGWDAIRLAGGIVPVSSPPATTLLSLGDDPTLLLPMVDAGPAPREIKLDVKLRFSRRMLEFPGLFAGGQPPASPGRNCVNPSGQTEPPEHGHVRAPGF
jgi:hypothetical protein